MIEIEIHPREGVNAYTLLRSKVHQAATWRWGNRAKTRLRHVQSEGWVDVKRSGRVVTARVVPKSPRDVFYLAEKLTGRLVAWFGDELVAIHVKLNAPGRRKTKPRAKRAKARRRKK
jgi:hypothetical protein